MISYHTDLSIRITNISTYLKHLDTIDLSYCPSGFPENILLCLRYYCNVTPKSLLTAIPFRHVPLNAVLHLRIKF